MSMSQPLVKREKFAIQLRKEKKDKILQQKRLKLSKSKSTYDN